MQNRHRERGLLTTPATVYRTARLDCWLGLWPHTRTQGADGHWTVYPNPAPVSLKWQPDRLLVTYLGVVHRRLRLDALTRLWLAARL